MMSEDREQVCLSEIRKMDNLQARNVELHTYVEYHQYRPSKQTRRAQRLLGIKVR